MQRAAILLAGGLAGMAMGWILFEYPISAFFGPTTVTWDATACPAGVYTVTSTARGLDGGAAYLITIKSTNVKLPRKTLVQEFPNLPPGQYSVTATVLNRRGQVVGSSEQTVEGQGRPSVLVRRRPPSTPRSGKAQPRGFGTTPQYQPVQSAGAVTAAQSAPLERASAWARVTPTAEAAGPVPWPLALPRELERLLLQLSDNADALGIDSGWRHVEFADTDGDGAVDLIRVETASGELLVWASSPGGVTIHAVRRK